nr:MAPEG family protein [Panacagrimonas sp.]
MTPSPLLAPMAALIGWTLIVLLIIPFRRIRAGLAGELTPDDFRYGESARVSGEVGIPNRAWMNLLEAPVLFYALCLASIAAHAVDGFVVGAAWTYAGLRVVHSLIHLGYNRVVHRLVVFAVSNVVLTLLWIKLVVALLRT